MTALYLAWCGAAWVLRGGAFGALCRRFLGFEPGTTLTRIACAGLMAAPMAALDWRYLALWPSIYAAMTIGYFRESMGLEKPGDWAWLALWGATVAAIAIAPLAFLVSPWALTWAAFGALAWAAYAINKPFGRRYRTDWTERAEALTGVAMGAAIWGAAL